MARCACGNATCSCVITPGDGVTVIGNGSPTRPYEIGLEATSLQISNNLRVNSTPTLTLSSAGSGTSSDKMTIYGYPTLKLRDLLDVSDTDTPANGDVVTWMTDHWEFLPPPAGGSGSSPVAVADGLTGDGLAATPLKVRFPPLTNPPYPPLSQVIGSNAELTLKDYGWPVLADEAGNLRIPPFVIAADDTAKWNNGTTLPSYPFGVSVLTQSAAVSVPGGWPAGSASILTVKRFDTGSNAAGLSGFQLRSSASNTLGASQLMFRSGNASGWGPWIPYASDTGWIHDQGGTSLFVPNSTNATLTDSWVRKVGQRVHVFLAITLKVASNSPGNGSDIFNINLGTMASAYIPQASGPDQALGSGGSGRLLQNYITGGAGPGAVFIAAAAGNFPMPIGENVNVNGSYFL